MFVARLCVVVMGLPAAVPAPAAGQQPPRAQQRRADAIPANVEAHVFTAEMLALLRLSETFRAQCARIGDAPRLRVRLSVVSAIDGGGRAQTTFRRYPGGALVADVEVLFGENYWELLAHEFEHVIEQIDGVDLRHEAAGGRAWEVAAGAFETRRASTAGVQVLRETAVMHARPAAVVPLR